MTYLIYAALCNIGLLLSAIFLSRIEKYSLTELFGVMLGFISGVLFIILSINSYSYVKASVQAELINAQYGTAYTTDQIYFASDIIDEISEAKRSRIDMRSHITKEKPELGKFYQQRD